MNYLHFVKKKVVILSMSEISVLEKVLNGLGASVSACAPCLTPCLKANIEILFNHNFNLVIIKIT